MEGAKFIQMSEPNPKIKKERDYNISLAPTDKEWRQRVNKKFSEEERRIYSLFIAMDELQKVFNPFKK